MVMEHEKRGLIKVYWKNIRNRVLKIEPLFTKIVDELDPDESFPLYLAYYPYGSTIADPQYMYLPKNENSMYSWNDSDMPKDVIHDLSYGKNSLCMGMVLEKGLEVYLDLKNEMISIPWLIYEPGTFFPFAKTLNEKSARNYAPNDILTIVSGARSTFMLPHVGCLTNHINLQRDFNIQSPPPKLLYEHWYLFREIIDSKIIDCNWQSCLLYFSENWLTHLHNDKAWLTLKMYLHKLAWLHFEYRRNYIYYDIAFSVIQKKRNLKPNPYLADTASHLFTTALGAAPGFAPACDDHLLPIHVLQQAFVESYGMKKYYPTIMQPVHFRFEQDRFPVYYSLQNPSTFVFSPKSRKISSTLFEMRELQHIMKIFLDELSKKNILCSETIISEIAKYVDFRYFHNELDRHHVIKPTTDIASSDKRFHFVTSKYKIKQARPSSDARFLRGCIQIRPNNI